MQSCRCWSETDVQHQWLWAQISSFKDHSLCSQCRATHGRLSSFICITNVNKQTTNSPGSLNRTLNLLLEDNFKWSFSALSNFKTLKICGESFDDKSVNKSKCHQMEFHICWGRLPGLFWHHWSRFYSLPLEVKRLPQPLWRSSAAVRLSEKKPKWPQMWHMWAYLCRP